MIIDPYQKFRYLIVEIQERRDGKIYLHPLNLDESPLITEESAPVWARYFHDIIRNSLTEETMNSQAYKDVERQVRDQVAQEKKWAQQAELHIEREHRRRSLRRTPSLGYIPEGLNVDYDKQYGYYIDSAIQWTPEDNDDFLYQIRSMERMVTKCVSRCIELKRPDAAYAQASEVLRSLPKWKQREELANYFIQYKPRLRKLVKTACTAMTSSAIAWNNMKKLTEANALIEAFQAEFVCWGMKRMTMLDLRFMANITGEPIPIERKPNKAELYEIERAQRKAKEEARRKAEEEAEKRSLIPLNQYLEQTVFDSSHIDWECMTIGRMINTLGSEVKNFLNEGKTHEALLLFLQTVKSMCRHYIKDEHYNYFDDMYDPDYSCMNIVDDLNEAYAKGKFSQSDLDFFHQAWKEIEQTEAYNEGIADYKFKF